MVEIKGFKKMLSFLIKRKKKHQPITIDITPTQVSLVQIQYDNTNTPKAIISETKSYSDLKELSNHITKIVTNNNFQNSDCNIVLHPDYYHLLLVDKPQVPENEYKLALRWQIKGMVNIPTEDLAIDFFKPPTNIAQYNKKLYVIASKLSFLKDIVTIIQQASLNPIVIDIHEFAIRNLLFFIEQTNNSIACLHFLDNNSIFSIFENNEIYLSRNIPYGINNITTEEVTQNIITQIKNTLDYYMHQLNQSLPNKIVIPCTASNDPINIEKLKTELGINIEYLRINTLTIFKQIPIEQIQNTSYIALGEELRKEIIKNDTKH